MQYKRLLGDGRQWGGSDTKNSPDGLAQAFILGEDFLDGLTLILGDNIFLDTD